MKYSLIQTPRSDLSPLVQVLYNRGIPLSQIPHYLKPSELDNLPSSNLNNIRAGIKLLLKHLADPNARIMVQVDADCDGYCSASAFLNYMNAAFPSTMRNFTMFFMRRKHMVLEKKQFKKERL